MDYSPPGSSVHGDFLGKNIGVGCHFLLQGIFPTQGSNLGLPHCRLILYHLSHQGSPRILEWVAYPFSRGSSRPRNGTRVSCIVGGFSTSWAMTAFLKKANNMCGSYEGTRDISMSRVIFSRMLWLIFFLKKWTSGIYDSIINWKPHL